MERFYFEAQLCSEIANLKEKSKTFKKYAKNRLTGGVYIASIQFASLLRTPAHCLRAPKWLSSTPVQHLPSDS